MSLPGGYHKSWVAKLAPGRQCLYDLRLLFADQRRAFYFLLIDPPKEQEFLRAVELGRATDLHVYGRVLESGWGEPDDAVKARMRAMHHANL